MESFKEKARRALPGRESQKGFVEGGEFEFILKTERELQATGQVGKASF